MWVLGSNDKQAPEWSHVNESSYGWGALRLGLWGEAETGCHGESRAVERSSKPADTACFCSVLRTPKSPKGLFQEGKVNCNHNCLYKHKQQNGLGGFFHIQNQPITSSLNLWIWEAGQHRAQQYSRWKGLDQETVVGRETQAKTRHLTVIRALICEMDAVMGAFSWGFRKITKIMCKGLITVPGIT